MKWQYVCVSILLVSVLCADEEKKQQAKAAGPSYGPVVVTEIEKGSTAVKLDITYWIGKSQGIIHNTVSSATSEVLLPTPTINARPGIKLGGGVFIDSMKSEVAIEYIWFYNEQSKDTYKYYNVTGTDVYGTVFQRTGGSFANNFNSFEGVIKKRYIFDQGITLEPYGGLIANWGHQWFTTINGDPLSGTVTTQETKTRANISGFGPSGGFNVRFFVPDSLTKNMRIGLIVDSGAALCYNPSTTKCDVRENAVLTNRTKRKDDDLVPMLKGALGLVCQFMLGKEKEWSVATYLKWDAQTWFNYAYLHPNTLNSSGNNYTMQGATLGLEGNF